MAETSAGLGKRDEKSPNNEKEPPVSTNPTVANDGHMFGDFGPGIWSESAHAKSGKSPQNGPGNQNEGSDFQTAAEYAQAVQGWIWQYYYWTSMNNFYASCFPFYCMGYSQAYANAAVSSAAGLPPHQGQGRGGPAAGNLPQQNGMPPRQDQRRPPEQQTPGYQDYRIPPIWKRVVAEFIDFLLLLLIKVGVTCILVDYTGTISRIPNYNIPLFEDFDPVTSLEELYLMLVWALLFRLIVCGYEALCLRNGIRTIGGSTPGKRVMGLCVVSCIEAIDLPDNKVRIIPAQNIGFWNALVRSVIKNFSLAFLFPMCFTALFFAHGRAAYDIISNCVVVESNDDLLLGQQR